MVNPGASTEALTWEPWVGSPHLNKACPLQAQLIVMSTQNLIIIRLLQICTIQTPTSDGLRAQSLTNMIRVSREWLVICGHHLFSRVENFLYPRVPIAQSLYIGVPGSGYTPVLLPEKFPPVALLAFVFLGFLRQSAPRFPWYILLVLPELLFSIQHPIAGHFLCLFQIFC